MMAVWQSSAPIENLKKRAKIIRQIRRFFDERDCFEVSTPSLSQFGNTEPNIQSFSVAGQGYLNTSPEFHMKRLLASGSGAIYQICSAFRQDEQGAKHNREFTMLEWYRPNWTLNQLMQELVDLIHIFMPKREVITLTYTQALFKFTQVDWVNDSTKEIECQAQALLGEIPRSLAKDELLDLLFCACVEPNLPKDQWCFITQYPPSQAALAKKVLNEHSQEVAMRFELYGGGMELANGYWELTDWQEQLLRFREDNTQRSKNGRPEVEMDVLLVEALKHGMPECSGVAVGIERLLMMALQESNIEKVMSFNAMRS